MNEALNLTTQLMDYALLAWFIAKLQPLQKLFELIADKNNYFYALIYPVVSCFYCLGFWITGTCFIFDLKVPEKFVLTILVAFVISSVKNVYERIIR